MFSFDTREGVHMLNQFSDSHSVPNKRADSPPPPSGAQYPTSELVKVAGRSSLNLPTDCSLTTTHTLPANEASPQQKLALIADASH